MSLSSSSQDWMVLQCQACGARMKSRRDVAPDSRLQCPKCGAPVPAVPPEAEVLPSPEFRPEPLPERPVSSGLSDGGTLPGLKPGTVFEGGKVPLNFRRQLQDPLESSGAHPEFDGSLPPGGHPQEAQERPGGQRRSRIKRRRRSDEKIEVELTDWDQRNPEIIPEAEIAADTWGNAKPLPEDLFHADGTEFVVETEDADGQTRTTKKRVQRRRALVGTRLFFQRITSFSRYFTIGLGLLLAGVAAYGFTLLRKSYVAPPLAPVTETPLDRRVLTEQDMRESEKVVRDFLAADGIEAKLPFIRQPQRVRPLMEKWYQTRSAGPLTAGPVSLQQKTGGELGAPGYFIMLALPVRVPDPGNPGSTTDEVTFFSVEEIRKDSGAGGSTYLLDWETSTGYQDMPLETFQSTMPKEPRRFRVFVKTGDYYNHGFDEREWQCVELTYPGRDFHLWGYVSRSSSDARMLLIKLESGWIGPMIAELQYPENSASSDQVMVTRMVHPSWFYADGEEVEK